MTDKSVQYAPVGVVLDDADTFVTVGDQSYPVAQAQPVPVTAARAPSGPPPVQSTIYVGGSPAGDSSVGGLQPATQWQMHPPHLNERIMWLKRVYSLGVGIRWLAIIDLVFLFVNVLLYWNYGGVVFLLRSWGPVCGLYSAAPRFKKFAALFFAVSYFFQISFLFVLLALGWYISLIILVLDMFFLYYTALFARNLFACSPSEIEMLRNPVELRDAEPYFYYF